MFSDRAKPLDGDPRSFQLQLDGLRSHVDGGGEAVTGGAQLIQRDAAQLPRQTRSAADLVFYPAHGQLVGAHVGTRNVIAEACNGAGKRPN